LVFYRPPTDRFSRKSKTDVFGFGFFGSVFGKTLHQTLAGRGDEVEEETMRRPPCACLRCVRHAATVEVCSLLASHRGESSPPARFVVAAAARAKGGRGRRRRRCSRVGELWLPSLTARVAWGNVAAAVARIAWRGAARPPGWCAPPGRRRMPIWREEIEG
jgi:hypothetical protein